MTKYSTERQNQYLDFLTDPSFQKVNGIFVSLFKNGDDRKNTQDIIFQK